MTSEQNCEHLALPASGEVHCWRVVVSENLPRLADWERVLSQEEAARAAKFLRTEDSERYVVAHGVLRWLLGGYLGCEPARIEFRREESGKPVLVLREGWPAVSFNLAHSGDVVLIAVAIGRRVGVDVEMIRADRDVMELARAQFSEEEVAALEALHGEELTSAFYRTWALKEAYVKARGEGLGFPLGDFSVTAQVGEAPAIKWVADDPEASGRWTAFVLSPIVGYAGALVVEGPPPAVFTRSWQDSTGLARC